MPFTPKELEWVGVSKETTWGTAVAPTYFIPFKDAKLEDKIDTIEDNGIRGSLAETYNVIQGFKQSDADLSGDVFPDSFGLFLLAMLGVDTVTGSVAPYTHTFKLGRTAQPPSITINKYDGTSIRQFAGLVAEQLDIKWADKAALEYSLKLQGKSSSVNAGPITPSTTATIPFTNWIFTVKFGEVQSLHVVGFDFTIKRKLYVQHAISNSQDPTSVTALALGVTGKITFDKADDTELSMFLNNTQQSIVITGTQPGSGAVLTIQLSKAAFKTGAVSEKDVVQLDVDIIGIDNTADGGPCSVILQNAVASY